MVECTDASMPHFVFSKYANHAFVLCPCTPAVAPLARAGLKSVATYLATAVAFEQRSTCWYRPTGEPALLPLGVRTADALLGAVALAAAAAILSPYLGGGV